MSDKPTVEFSFTNGHNKEVARTVNLVADARDFIDMAGYVWVIMAANPELSTADMGRFLAGEFDGAYRPQSWLKRRRWLFKRPGEEGQPGPQPNQDGNAKRAIRIMQENTNLSCPQLSRLLKEHDIVRSREWVRKHRCDE